MSITDIIGIINGILLITIVILIIAIGINLHYRR